MQYSRSVDGRRSVRSNSPATVLRNSPLLTYYSRCPPPLSLVGKVHGSLARAGKVRGQTPKVAPQEKAKKPTGRACKRVKYNRRFVNVVTGFGKKRGPNSQ